MSSLEFLAIGANRLPDASDWSEDLQLFAFGAGHCVAIWHQEHSVERTIKGHTKVVTSVKFAKDIHNGTIIISGSEDGTLKVWDQHYKLIQTLNVGRSITFVKVESKRKIMISGSMDGTVRCWKLNQDNAFELIDSNNIGTRFYPLCGSVFVFDETTVLAIGGTSNEVHLYTVEEQSLSLQTILSGHENWVKTLDFTRVPGGEVLLASGSEDRYIRLWKFSEQEREPVAEISLLDKLSNDDTDDGQIDETLTNKVYDITTSLHVTFEAMLMGHDDWIAKVKWHPTEICLFSASADSSVMQWKPDESSGIWVCAARLGDVSIKGSSTATGSSGGFWTLVVAKQGNLLGTVSRTGSWRLWKKASDKNVDDWISLVSITGHTKETTDCSWQDNEEYLLTTSLDQTTKLFAPKKSSTSGNSAFYEFSRPQIHGYDMVCVKSVTSTLFVSAGDEKTIRVFEEPQGVADLLTRVSGSKAIEASENLPGSATVPALGLSNKETAEDFETKADVEDEDFEDRVINGGFNQNPNHTTTTDLLAELTEPPREEHLQRHTLWPELEKLYGHGYEISCIDVSHDKKLLATCCKSNNEAHAIIRVYDMKTWHQQKPLASSHGLTVTRVRFSPDDSYLLSVSRDRTFAIWKRNSVCSNSGENTESPYSLALAFKGHSRIIWDCAWINNEHFVTSGRDKAVKLWNISGKLLAQISLPVAVTAVDYSPVVNTIVAGLETGSLYTYKVNIGGQGVEPSFTLLENLSEEITPDSRVTRLNWGPYGRRYAVTSEDSSVRIYSV